AKDPDTARSRRRQRPDRVQQIGVITNGPRHVPPVHPGGVACPPARFGLCPTDPCGELRLVSAPGHIPGPPPGLSSVFRGRRVADGAACDRWASRTCVGAFSRRKVSVCLGSRYCRHAPIPTAAHTTTATGAAATARPAPASPAPAAAPFPSHLA